METMKNIQLLTVYFTDQPTTSSAVSSIFRTNVTPKHLDDEDFYTFTWSMDTKYFTAHISVCCCPDHFFDNIVVEGCASVMSSQLLGVEAILLIADLNDDKSIDKVKRIVSTVADQDIDVCLLYCTKEITNPTVRDDVNKYCIEHQFEMVEKEDDNTPLDDEEDVFAEKVGVDRVVEALKSHVWSGHVMKDLSRNNSTEGGPGASRRSTSGLDPGEGASGTGYGPSSSAVAGEDTLGDFSELNELAGDLCDTDGSFQELFGKFLTMKETAKSLNGEERREYAAKVSMAFMDALGIDEGESSASDYGEGEGEGLR